ncbi:hypothetical protein Sjap_004638 [Stephania japonica]|uniref:Uncharacterized protein n=1 Tax=Stephania japonica TaxID=461633 RepID=A0AAP0K4X3_9MAGN
MAIFKVGYGSSDYNATKGIIGISQPRHIAVLAMAKRVAYELDLHLGKEVGFQIKHDRRVRSSCSIKFMTDKILLRETQFLYEAGYGSSDFNATKGIIGTEIPDSPRAMFGRSGGISMETHPLRGSFLGKDPLEQQLA